MSFLLIVAIILAIVGFVGCIVPSFPGLPFAFLALVCSYFNFTGCISVYWVVFFFVLTLVAMVLDYVAPVYLTKLGGGSKRSVTGASIGMAVAVICVFIPVVQVFSILLLIVAPMIGAYIGEVSQTSDHRKAFKMAMLNLLSFLLTTIFKLVLCCVMIFFTFAPLFHK